MKILPSICSFKKLFLAMMFLSVFVTGFAQAQNSNGVIAGEETFSQAELEQMLAPIALYPDTILSHILVASTYPLEVVQAERWALKNPELQGQAAVEAATKNDWDPSVQALVAFPQILKRMSQELEWTQRLGGAFIQDEELVLASVQSLRELAQKAGSLDEMEKVTVSRDQSSIIIEPREREVVYVPYYDTRVVYGPWRWQHYQPIYWGYPYANSLHYDNDYYAHNPHSSFFWGPRTSLSFGFFSNAFHWRNHYLVRISPRHYQSHRYYGHHDILGHRYANRWVHNSHRLHGNSNRHISRHAVGSGDQTGSREVDAHRNDRIHANQQRQYTIQEQVRDRLIRQRNRHVETNSSRRVLRPQNRSVVNQGNTANRNTSVNRRTLPNRAIERANRPTVRSGIALPGRSRAVEDNRRANNRPVTRQINRQPAAQARNQPSRAATPPAQPRPAARPAPQRAANRPAARPRPAAADRKAPSTKVQTPTHREKRQPR